MDCEYNLSLYKENLEIRNLIKHIVYSSWEHLDDYKYIGDVEIDVIEEDSEEDDYYNDDYIAGKKNKWW